VLAYERVYNNKHCNTVQHTATHYNTLQPTDTLQHTATHFNILQHTATYCNNTLQNICRASYHVACIYLSRIVKFDVRHQQGVWQGIYHVNLHGKKMIVQQHALRCMCKNSLYPTYTTISVERTQICSNKRRFVFQNLAIYQN